MSADLQALSSEELASRFAETGDNVYFEEIERRHRRRVWATAYSVLRDFGKAEDVAQESFLLLSMAGDRFKGGSVAGWLSQVARRLALNLSKRTIRQEALESHFVRETLQNDSPVMAIDPRLLTVLSELPPEQRICLNLRYGEGFSYQEIMARTGFTFNQVKTHIQNGCKNFSKRWKKREHNGGRR